MTENRDASTKRSTRTTTRAESAPGATPKKRATRTAEADKETGATKRTSSKPTERAEPAARKSTRKTTAKAPPSQPISAPARIEPETVEGYEEAYGPINEAPSEEERHAMIQRIAYFRAQWRGWTPGGELDDWLHAEREVDEMLRAKREGRSE